MIRESYTNGGSLMAAVMIPTSKPRERIVEDGEIPGPSNWQDQRQVILEVQDTDGAVAGRDFGDGAENTDGRDLVEMEVPPKIRSGKGSEVYSSIGVIVTTTTSKVVYGNDESVTNYYTNRKQEWRELKKLQKQEQKQFQDLTLKGHVAVEAMKKKFEREKMKLTRKFETEMESKAKLQKQELRKTEKFQEKELKELSRTIRRDQEKEVRILREGLKEELKLMKQELEDLPKHERKLCMRVKKLNLDRDQHEREKEFMEKINEIHDSLMKCQNEVHRANLVAMDKEYLEQRQDRTRLYCKMMWALEESLMNERNQLKRQQIEDFFKVRRHQILIRHESGLKRHRRVGSWHEEKLLKIQLVEKRALPKQFRRETRNRETMFREYSRIGATGAGEKQRMRNFKDAERKMYKAEEIRLENKHQKQLEEIRWNCEAAKREFEQLRDEKRVMLMENEDLVFKELDEICARIVRKFESLVHTNQMEFEAVFVAESLEQREFYGEVNGNISRPTSESSLMLPSFQPIGRSL